MRQCVECHEFKDERSFQKQNPEWEPFIRCAACRRFKTNREWFETHPLSGLGYRLTHPEEGHKAWRERRKERKASRRAELVADPSKMTLNEAIMEQKRLSNEAHPDWMRKNPDAVSQLQERFGLNGAEPHS